MKWCDIMYALSMLLISSLSVYAQEAVVYDDSQAKEMQTVWTRPMNKVGLGVYLPNVADIPGHNIVTIITNGEYRTWPTVPLLDTSSTSTQWINGKAYGFIMPFDFDGVPPMEYFSVNAVFRPSLDGRTMTVVDTVNCLRKDNESRSSVDVDGDGRMDAVVHGSMNGDAWFQAVLAGPDRGRGCARTLSFPNGFASKEMGRDRWTMRMMRCADGKLRMLYFGTIYAESSVSFLTGIYLLDVHVQQAGNDFSISYTVADSIVHQHFVFQGEEFPWVVRPVTGVDDAKSGHQYAIVNWQDGFHPNHNTTVLYEVSNGRLVERLSTKGQVLGYVAESLDNKFDDGEAVIRHGRHFSRVSTFHKPFAKFSSTIGLGKMAFIDDQFGDGSRDLLCADNGNVSLVNFDLQPTGVEGNDLPKPAWAILESGLLRLTLERPSTIWIDAVNSIGQK